MIGINDVIDLFILLCHFVELSSGNQSSSSFESSDKVAIFVSECHSCNFQFLVWCRFEHRFKFINFIFHFGRDMVKQVVFYCSILSALFVVLVLFIGNSHLDRVICWSASIDIPLFVLSILHVLPKPDNQVEHKWHHDSNKNDYYWSLLCFNLIFNGNLALSLNVNLSKQIIIQSITIFLLLFRMGRNIFIHIRR